MRVLRPTRRIVVDSVELAIARATLDGDAAPAETVLDAPRRRASFTFGHVVAPGRHTLRIAYRGRINDQAAGLFQLHHATPAGPATSAAGNILAL